VRYLVLSDIHANWEALEAVLEDAAGRYEEIVCCGDLVGYGADPNRVVEWARRHVRAIVRGNHDKAAFHPEVIEWFSPGAAAAMLWTRSVLRDEHLEYLRRLPKGPVLVGGFAILHGSPVDEDEYVIEDWEAQRLFGYLIAEINFFGHSHLQGGFLLRPEGAETIRATPPGRETLTLKLEPGPSFLINPGSVGQPRDYDPRAAYVLYDEERRHVSYRRVAYDVETAQRKIRMAGLPEGLAERLAYGA
jgi:predicted phosphodiesterase